MATIVQLVLIGILAYCGVSLRTQFDKTRSGIRIERDRAAMTQQVVTSVTGIDVSGKLRAAPAQGPTRFVVAGLRASSADEDLRVWTSVAELLKTDPAIHIIGYCDERGCADKALAMSPSLPLTVMRCAEAANGQALLRADAQGESLVLDRDMKTIKRIAWRSPRKAPAEIVREVRQ